MKIAFIVFNNITWLDFIGVYDPITRLYSMGFLSNLTWDICSFTNTVTDNFGLELRPTKIKNSLSDYDAIIIPGGKGTRELQFDKDFISWIQTSAPTQYKISICTGSLILGASGFLKDKMATTHFNEYETLKPYCKEVLMDNIVVDGNIITGGAVSSSIDIGLYLCERWAGKDAMNQIKKSMNY